MSNQYNDKLYEHIMDQLQEMPLPQLVSYASELAEDTHLPPQLIDAIYEWFKHDLNSIPARCTGSELLDAVSYALSTNDLKLMPTAVYEPLLFWLVDLKLRLEYL